MSEESAAPPPDDVGGWAAAIAAPAKLARLKREDVIKAARHPVVRANRHVFSGIMEFLNRAILKEAGNRVRASWKDEGKQIAERVQHHLITSILDLASADGKQMERRYWAVLKTRTIDAVRDEWKREATAPDTVSTEDTSEEGDTDTMQLAEYRAEMDRILSSVPDERKKLAFRLHLQGVPLKPGKGTTSIGGALRVSDKTAGQWVAEMVALVKSKVGESK
jgi:hypothetical protein